MTAQGFGRTLVVLSAPVGLGFAAGLLTGQTGADSTVVAAVLPALLTGIGGGLLALALKIHNGDWTPYYVITGASIALFSVSLVAGVYLALYAKETVAYDDAIKQRHRYVDALAFRRRALEQCSKNEYMVNESRKALGLTPLSFDIFCDIPANIHTSFHVFGTADPAPVSEQAGNVQELPGISGGFP